jgi:hypothetical protein
VQSFSFSSVCYSCAHSLCDDVKVLIPTRFAQTQLSSILTDVRRYQSALLDCDGYGLEELVAPKNPIVEYANFQPYTSNSLVKRLTSIIAVHGLDGRRRRSWTAKNGALWLRDFLPTVAKNARILTYGYNVHTRGRHALSDQKIHSLGEELITSIAADRTARGVCTVPICHQRSFLTGLSGTRPANNLHCA